MKSFDDLIKSRRSIRKYKDRVPDEDLIRQMVLCASFAPSPSNAQPVRFIQIGSLEVRDKIYREMAKGRDDLLRQAATKNKPKKIRNIINAYWRFSRFMFDAPALFAVGVVSGVKGFSKKLFEAEVIPSDIRGDTDLDITVGLALKGFILKGHELGLGTCVLTGPLTFLACPETFMGVADICVKCFVSAGFPDETPEPVERKPFEDLYLEI